MPITRRRLLATSGAGLAAGSAAVLSACGSDEDEPSSERDVELLGAALAAERTVADLYTEAARQSLAADAAAAVESFGKTSSEQANLLLKAVNDAGGEDVESNTTPPAAESVLEAIGLALEQAIAAYHAAVGELSTVELRRTVYELMGEDAAQLAVVRGLLGDEQVPEAFVTGLDEAPLVAPPPEEDQPEEDSE